MLQSTDLSRLSLIGTLAGLLSACTGTDLAPPSEQTQSLPAGLSGGPEQAVRASFRAKGRGAEADSLRSESEVASRGTTHVRMEQVLEGLRVHGAFVKAGVSGRGEVVYSSDRLARPNGHIPRAPALGETCSLRCSRSWATSQRTSARSGTDGNTTRLRGAASSTGSTVERIAFVDDNGLPEPVSWSRPGR